MSIVKQKVKQKKYKTYKKYRDSGTGWLGKIPAGWKVMQLRRIARVVGGSTPKTSHEDYWDGNISWYTPEDLGKCHSKFIESSKRKITKMGYKSCGTELIPRNSLILSTRAPIGHLALLKNNSCFNQGCKGLSFKKNLVSSYYYYHLSSVRSVLEARGQGSTFIELNTLNLKSFFVLCPDFKTQKRIANFLDKKTAKIDKLIQKNKKLIKLLEEKRQAAITQAVTKGLDPNVKMKDSGVKWIGEIPKTWQVIKLKFIANNIFSNVDKKIDKKEIPIQLCNYIDVYKNDYITDSVQFMSGTATYNEIEKFKIKTGDVLVTKDSETPEDIAMPAFVKKTSKDLVCGYHLAILRPRKKRILGNYLFWLFMSRSFNQYFETSAKGITRYGLSISAFNDVKIPLPDIKGQRIISIFLENISDKTHNLMSKLVEENKKLAEYRQAVISNAVTGKIKVN